MDESSDRTTDASGRLEFGDVVAGDYALYIGRQTYYVPAIRKSERFRPLSLRPVG